MAATPVTNPQITLSNRRSAAACPGMMLPSRAFPVRGTNMGAVARRLIKPVQPQESLPTGSFHPFPHGGTIVYGDRTNRIS